MTDLQSSKPLAMWFVGLLGMGNRVEIPEDLAHPQSIRQWHRDLQTPQARTAISIAAIDIPAAWATIKRTAAEQRELWRDVGDALLEGRAMCAADRDFKVWCDNEGFGDVKADTRTAALWLARNWSVIVTDLPAGLTHPEAIRRWHRDSQASKPPAPDLDISAPADAALERIAKAANHEDRGE